MPVKTRVLTILGPKLLSNRFHLGASCTIFLPSWAEVGLRPCWPKLAPVEPMLRPSDRHGAFGGFWADLQNVQSTIAGNRGTDFWRRPGEHPVRSHPLLNCTTPQHLRCGRISKPCQDFSRRASGEATVKAKDGVSNNPCISCSLENTTLNNNQFWAPGQKQHQLSEDAHLVLFDNCCLWTWMRKKMVTTFNGEVVEKHDKLFDEGLLTFTRQSSFPVGPGSQNFQMLWLRAYSAAGLN